MEEFKRSIFKMYYKVILKNGLSKIYHNYANALKKLISEYGWHIAMTKNDYYILQVRTHNN